VPSQKSFDNHLFQRVKEKVTHTFHQEEDNVRQTQCGTRDLHHNLSHLQVNVVGKSMRQTRRTTIVAHRTTCFGQNDMSTEDVSPSDVSTVAMELITPLQEHYWSRVDEFMESGDLNDLCPKSVDVNMNMELDSVG